MREQVLGQHPSLDDKLVLRDLKGHSNYKIVFQLPQERNSATHTTILSSSMMATANQTYHEAAVAIISEVKKLRTDRFAPLR